MPVKTHRRLTSEEIQGIAALWRDGKTLKEAGAAYGRSEGTACYILDKLGITEGRGKWKPRKYTLDESYFSIIDTEEKAYWLGFLAADGNVSRGNRIQLGLADVDAGHVEKFCHAIGFNGPIKRKPARSKTCAGKTYVSAGVALAVVNSLRMANDLARHGVVAAKSFILKPWQAPALDLQRAWWRGIMDGDGSVCLRQENGNPKPIIQCAGTYEVVEAFMGFIDRNTTSIWRKKGRTPRPHRGIFVIQYSGIPFTQEIVRLLYGNATICLDRKKAVAEQILSLPTRKMVDLGSFACETVLEAKRQAGTWTEVAKLLGVPLSGIFRVCKHLGIPGPRRGETRGKPFSSYSREAFLEARDRLGNWKAAAIEIGLPVGSIAGLRAYFGLL